MKQAPKKAQQEKPKGGAIMPESKWYLSARAMKAAEQAFGKASPRKKAAP